MVFPVFYEPILKEEIESRNKFSIDSMRADHLELYRTSYEINFKRVPKLMWDNQRAGGVPWFKRMILQGMGRAEIANWRMAFRKMAKKMQSSAEKGFSNSMEKSDMNDSNLALIYNTRPPQTEVPDTLKEREDLRQLVIDYIQNNKLCGPAWS